MRLVLVVGFDSLRRLRLEALSGLPLRSLVRPVRSLERSVRSCGVRYYLALHMLACTRVLRFVCSGRAEVKFLVPLQGGGVLVQVVHHGFVGTVGVERAA